MECYFFTEIVRKTKNRLCGLKHQMRFVENFFRKFDLHIFDMCSGLPGSWIALLKENTTKLLSN